MTSPAQQELAEWFKKPGAELCSCGNETQIVFHCAHEACPPEKKGQPYCTSCCEVGKHPFPHKKIIRFLNEYVWDRWTALNTSLTELLKKATAEYQKYKQLIIYFEQELLLRPIQPGEIAL